MDEVTQTTQYEEVRDYALLEESLRKPWPPLYQVILLSASVLAISLALFHIFVAGFGTPESHSFRSIHLAVMLVLAILFNPTFRTSITAPLTIPGDAGNWRLYSRLKKRPRQWLRGRSLSKWVGTTYLRSTYSVWKLAIGSYRS